MVEFQSEVDGTMAKRVRDYTEMLLDRVVRSGAPKRADKDKAELGIPPFDEFERTGEGAMPTIAEANWDRWEAGLRAEGRKQGVRQGRAQGRTEGRVGLISRQAALKFGPWTAERLSGLLDSLTARKDLDQVGDWIIECGNGEELLSRVSALHARAGNSQRPR